MVSLGFEGWRPLSWARRLLVFGLVTVSASAAWAAENSPFVLRPGVVVDQTRQVLYLATPEGSIEAVVVASGRSEWQSDAAALPLALTGRWLVSQSETSASGVLPIVVMDVATGRKQVEAQIALPAGVRATVSDSADRSFRATAWDAPGGVLTISWSQTELIKGGIAPDQPSTARIIRGAALLDPRNGRVTSLSGAGLAPRKPIPAAVAQRLGAQVPELGPFQVGSVVAAADGGHGDAVMLRRWDVQTGQPLPARTISERAVAALPSADERHLVAGEHAATDDLNAPQYRWQIVSLETGETVGALRRDAAAGPFFVSEGRVVLQSDPHGERGNEGEWVEDPLEIRSLGLGSGDVLWKRAIRDLEYRGVQPPGTIRKGPAPKQKAPIRTPAKARKPVSGPSGAVSFRPETSTGMAQASLARRGTPPASEGKDGWPRGAVPTLEADPPLIPEPPDPGPPPSLPSVGGAWVFQGPSPTLNGQAEGMTNRPVVGAVQSIVAHPTNPDVLWAGTVNGGVWKTTNATSASPVWTPLTDTFGSMSIGVLRLDPTDFTSNTLVAGIGRFSSLNSNGGSRVGLMRSTNGGSNWSAITGAGLLGGKNVIGVAARGVRIVVAVNTADSNTCGNIGIFSSGDTGANFTKISSGASLGATGLPGGGAFDLIGDPTNVAILYTAVRDASVCTSGGLNGVYKSTDTGATWTKVSDATMDALMANATVSNVKLAVGNAGQVYAGIINTGQLAGLFRSGNGGASWVQLDTPSTNENGTPVGIQPEDEPGGQGIIHFSIVADPSNPNLVYVGGDRQPGPGEGPVSWPNSIGATDYSGRLFRIDASLAPGSQARSLTHCATVNASCPSISTTSNSSPHADSRRLTFDAASNLLESDDGGVYKRTNPQGVGDWFSLNGSLGVAEMHNVAYDRVSNMIIGGDQDTGTPEQTTVGGVTWQEVHSGDGGDVQVDDITSATQSIRYSSFQNLGGFRRRVVDTSGVTTSTAFPARTVLAGGPAFVAQFVTPVEVNTVDATRVLFAGSNDLYESLDRGGTITALGLNKTVAAMVYGGASGGPNPGLIYAINGADVYVRTAGSGPLTKTATSPSASTLRDIAVDATDYQKAWAITADAHVFSTIDTGATWTDVTGNLGSGSIDLRSIVFVPGSPSAIVVGSGRPTCPCPPGGSVFRMTSNNPGVWTQLGSGIPNMPVWDLDYDPVDQALIAGTLGRGAWRLTLPGGVLAPVLSGTKTVSGSFAELSSVTYTVILTNSGTASQGDNAGAEFTDLLPSGLGLVSAIASSGVAGTAGNTVTWNGSIAVAGSVTITITATVNAGTSGSVISNQGTISFDANGDGVNEANALTDDPAVAGASDPTQFQAVSGPVSFYTVAPCRVIDTRTVPNSPALVAGADRTFTISSICGIPADAKAVSVNLAVTGPTLAGHLRLHPGGTPVPLISAINYVAGQTRSNNAVLVLSPSGQIGAFNGQASGTVHFILDVNGYFK